MALTVKAHKGDAKTLLAFDLPEDETTRLAGFTIQCQPQGGTPYYLFNELQFETPGDHAQVATEPAYSSVNAPFHKFRWLLATAQPDVESRGLTLVGIAVTNLESDAAVQLMLTLDRYSGDRLDAALDEARRRFGPAAVTRAVLLGRDSGLVVPLLPD